MFRTLHTKFARSLACTSIFATLFLLAERATAQFTAGRLVVERVGNGTGALGSAAFPTFVDEISIGGVTTYTVTIPTTTAGGLNQSTESGSATSDGFISVSNDGKYLVIPGYDAAVATAGVASAAVNKVITRIDAFGNRSSTVVTNASAYSGNNFRGVTTTDGLNFWMAGNGTATTGGVRYVAYQGSTTAVAATQVAVPNSANTRVPYAYGNSLYVSTGSGTTGVYSVTGLPTTGTVTATPIVASGGAADPYTMVIVNNGGTNVMYVCNNSPKLISKYYQSGGVWTAVGQYTTAVGYFGITATVTGTTVNIFCANNTNVVTFNDASAPTSSISGTPTVTNIATAATNTIYRGITFSPFTASVSGNATICSGGSSIITFTGSPNAIITYSLNATVQPTVSIPASGTYTVSTGAITSNATYALASVTDGRVVQTVGTSVTVTVNAAPSPTLSPATASIATGSSQILTFGGAPGDVITYTWTGGGPATTTIGAGGTSTVSVTPPSAGSYTYQVTSAVSALGCPNSSVTGVTLVLTVSDVPFASISGSTTICDGQSATLTFTGNANGTITYDDGTTSGLTILLDATGTATLSVTPLVGATTYNLTSITQSGGATTPESGSATVIVNPLPSSITGTLTVCVGGTTTLSDASSGTWSTSGAASVGSSSGIVSGVSAGTAAVVFTSGGCTTSAVVTVNPTPSAGSISGASSVCVGSVISLSDAAGSGVWASSSSNASVDGSGNVTGSTAGTATISYTVTNGFSCSATATQVVTVNPLANAGTINGVTTITGTGSVTLTDITGSTSGTWSSSNTGVATVGSTTGIVTGVVPGTSTISYTVVGCGTATATVNITVVAPPLVPFTVGDIVVEQLGKTDGSQPLSSTSGNSIFAVEYNGTTNTVVQTVAVTDAGTNGLIETGTGTSDGQMNRSANGKFLSITGYNIALGGSSSITSAAVPRGVGKVDGLGLYNFVAKDNNFYIGNNIRSSVSDGNTYYWTGGTPGGNNLFVDGGTDVVGVQSVTTSNTRTVGIYNGQLYYSTGSGTIGIYSVGVGLPTTAGQTAGIVITDGGTSPSPYGFSFNPGATVCYLADDRSTASGGGIQKWVASAGSYTLAYTYTAIDGANGCRGLTVDWSGAHPVIYVTTSEASANKIMKIVDFGSVATSTVTTVATAPTNTIFRGIALAPFTAKVAGNASFCGSGTSVITFTGSPGASITYSVNGTPVSPVTFDATGVYTVSTGVITSNATYALGSVTDGSIVQTVGTSVTVSVNAIPAPGLSPATATIPTGSAQVLTFTGNAGDVITYTWTGGGPATTTIGAGGTSTVSVTPPGIGSYTYSVTSATSAAGCTNSSISGVTSVLTVIDIPFATISGGTNICSGSSATLTFNGTDNSLVTYGDGSTPGLTVSLDGTGTATLSVTPAIGVTTYTLTSVTPSGGSPYTVSGSTAVTVNPIPSAISGTLTVCVGATTSLSDAFAGSWSSSAAGVASVGSATGIVTGASAGTATIVFTSNAGCTTSSDVTVNPVPVVAAITGASSVCLSSSTLLTDATLSGVWASSSSNATVDVSGNVTGASAGTATISYTVTNGFSCSTTATFNISVVVTPTVSAITGTTSIFATGSSNLTDATPGGVWSSTNTGAATVGSTGHVSGVAAGTTTISYTITNACGSIAATVNVTVAPVPSSFTRGNLVVVQTGNGSAALGSTATPIALVEFTTAGAPTGLIVPMPTTGTYSLTNSGSATSEGSLSLSGERDRLIVAGYNAPIGMTGVASTASSAVARELVATYPNATYSLVATTSTLISGNNIRGGTASGNNYFAAGASNGVVVFSGTVTPTQISTGIANSRLVQVYNGQLYMDASSGNFKAVSTIGTGVPTSASAVTTINPTTVGSSPYGFSFSPDGQTLYIADDGAGLGITKYTNNGSGFFNVAYSFPAATNARGLVVDYSGSQPVIYATNTIASANNIISFTDPGTAGAASSVGVSTIATAPTNTAFRGLMFAPSCYANVTTLSAPFCSGGNGQVVFTGNPTGVVTYSVSGVGTTTTTLSASGTSTVTLTSLTSSSTISLVNITTAGCSSAPVTGSTVVTVNPLPTVGTTGGGVAICSGAMATLNGTGAVSYSWTGGITDGVAFVPSTGVNSYTVTGTDGNGCTNTSVATVTVNAVPTVGTGGGGVSICSGFAALLSGTGAASYSWTGGITDGVSFVPSVGVNTYTVTGTTNGCSNTATTTITVNALPTVGSTGGGVAICTGSSVTLSGTGATSYSWTGGVTDGSSFSPSIGVNNYTVTGTDDNGCTNTATTSVTANAVPTVGFTGGGAICAGSNATLSGTGATSYSWTGGITNGVPFTPSLGVNTYTVTGTTTGCSNTAVATVTVNAVPTVGSTGGGIAICTGTTATLSGTGAASYSWTGGVVDGVAFAPSAGVNTYTVTGTTSGCSNTATTTITVNATPTGTITGPSGVTIGSNITLTDLVSGGTWSASNGNATVAGGIVHGVSAGTVTISYNVTGTCGAASATKLVTVGTGTVSVAAITGYYFYLCQNATAPFFDGTTGGAWSVDPASSSVASISATGVVTGLSAGTAKISYTVGVSSATAIVTVYPVPAAISGTPHVCQGLTTTLSDATPGGVWSSGIPATATVGTSGIVSGTNPGAAPIYYTLVAPAGCRAVLSVTVNANPAAVTGPVKVCSGSTIALTDATSGGAWSTTSSNISVDGTGGVTGGLAGSATVTYTLATGCFRTYNVTVNAAPAAISGNAQVCQGSTTFLTDATTGGMSWTSGNTSVATVSFSGAVVGVSTGTAGITYSITSTGCVATTIVTVSTVPAAITNNSPICMPSTITLSDATSGGMWSSNNTSVGTVDATLGVVTGIASGNATITYALAGAGCYATTVVTVSNGADAGTILGAGAVCVGSTANLSDAAMGGIWSSTNPAMGTVNTFGVVRGIAAGTTTISYTVTNSCGTSAATAVVTVNPLANAGTITGTTPVCAGSSIALANAITGGVWSSSNGNATVDGSGNVTGVSGGTSTISYTVTNSCGSASATTVVTVNAFTAGSISGASSVTAGLTITLSDAVSGGVWSASNSNATVSGVGLVTGVTAGTVTISYAVTNTCGSVSATDVITVNASGVSGITGTLSVCAGSTTALTDATTGGTWHSSNTSVATVGTSGIVTGVVTGTATISYTIAGVPTSVVVTVNPLPSGIGGATSVCNGSSVTMSDFTSGGTWTSTSGVSVTTGTTVTTVTGMTDGANTVTYTLATGCYKTYPVTVKTLPTSILGNLAVCGAGSVTFLSDATAGTSWTISPVGTATVSPSGRVYGVSPGNATVTYTAADGCITTATVTVNSLVTVTPILGATSVGHGLTILLSDATGGGVWSSSNPALGSVDATGDVTGVGAAGTITISYALSYAGGTCTALATKSITVHTPAPHDHEGTTVGGMIAVNVGVAVSLDEEGNGIWSSSNTDVVTVDGGVVTGIAPGAANIMHTVTNNNGEVSTSVTPVVVSAISMDVRVVPNPNNGAFTVKGIMGTTQDVEVTLEVTDVLGQVIYNNKVTATGGKISETISLNSTLANGMYMLDMHTATEHKVFHFVIEK